MKRPVLSQLAIKEQTAAQLTAMLDVARQSVLAAATDLKKEGHLTMRKAVALLLKGAKSRYYVSPEVRNSIEFFQRERCRMAGTKYPERWPTAARLYAWVMTGAIGVGRSKPAAAFSPPDTDMYRARSRCLDEVEAEIGRCGCGVRDAIKAVLGRARATNDPSDVLRATVLLARAQSGAKPSPRSGGLPDTETVVKWWRAADRRPALEQKRAATLAEVEPVSGWMDEAVSYKRAVPDMSAREVHETLLEVWKAEWGEPVKYASVTRALRLAEVAQRNLTLFGARAVDN